MSRSHNGTGSRISILWARTKKIRPVDDVGLYGRREHNQLSVVFLGLFIDLLPHRPEWFHR